MSSAPSRRPPSTADLRVSFLPSETASVPLPLPSPPVSQRACCASFSRTRVLRASDERSFASLPSDLSELRSRRKPVDLQGLMGRKPLLLACALLAAWTGLGVVCFRSAMRLSWTSAFYFAVATALTVGYGDVAPGGDTDASDATLLGTMVYICGSLALIGGSLGILMHSVLDRPGRSPCATLLLTLALCVVVLSLGALGICLLEGWRPIVGLYWAIVTLSTVGYGGVVPTTDGSRLFAALFMLAGVGCTGKLFSDFSALPLHAHRARLQRRVLAQYGEALDEEGLWELAAGDQLSALGLSHSQHFVTKNEYVLAMLVRMEKISALDLRLCQQAFEALDASGSGRLDMADVRRGARLASPPTSLVRPQQTSSSSIQAGASAGGGATAAGAR